MLWNSIAEFLLELFNFWPFQQTRQALKSKHCDSVISQLDRACERPILDTVNQAWRFGQFYCFVLFGFKNKRNALPGVLKILLCLSIQIRHVCWQYHEKPYSSGNRIRFSHRFNSHDRFLKFDIFFERIFKRSVRPDFWIDVTCHHTQPVVSGILKWIRQIKVDAEPGWV